MNLLPAFAVLGLVGSISGAPNYRRYIRQQPSGYQYFGSPYGQYQNYSPSFPGQNYQASYNNRPTSTTATSTTTTTTTTVPNRNGLRGNTLKNAPLGITVDFDNSFGSFPLGARNELTPSQRRILLPVMDSLLRVMESKTPSTFDVNTLMIQVRELLKQVPEAEMPNLSQYGFDVSALQNSMGIDLETLKSVALPATGDIIVNENGQDKIVTTFGKFPLQSLMTDAEREQFLPVVRSFINLLRKDVLDVNETTELLNQVRKLDSWNLFPFSVRGNNESGENNSGTTFNFGALSGLISGLVNSQTSFFDFSK